jgi:methyl-accepting chemotaxis protein
MAKEFTVRMEVIVIAVSLVIMIVLFWVYVRNMRKIRNQLDMKDTLRRMVSVMSHMVADVGGPVDTVNGGKISEAETPILASVMSALENVKVSEEDSEVYVFVVDKAGNMIVNGGNPELSLSKQGLRPNSNVLQHEVHGEKPIQHIIDKAVSGGGFVEYMWPHPHTTIPTKKLAYVKTIPGTEWVVGSGMYLK